MSSLVVRTTARPLEPLLLLYAAYLVLRGHDEPGGGFVAGLVATGAVVLRSIAEDARSARRMLGARPRALLAAGLATALGAALLPLARGKPPLTALWRTLPEPLLGVHAAGTPQLFDLGVFLTVLGATTTILFELEEE